MPGIPNPPAGSQELAEYSVGDTVYYFRAGKWRLGEIESQEGSSVASPRYWIKDDAKQDTRLIADSAIRKA